MPAVIAPMPAPALDARGRTTAAVFLAALALWVAETIPPHVTSLLVVVALAVTSA